MTLGTIPSDSSNVGDVDGITEGVGSQQGSETGLESLHSERVAVAVPPIDEEEDEALRLLPNTNIITHCILKNDPHRLVQCFEDDTNRYKEVVGTLLNERDNDGKSPLDLAACLGRLELTKELLARGADITSCNPKGYSCMHYAAAWGRLSVLKVHIENNGDLQQTNTHRERPKEVALRYQQEQCVDLLNWAEAKSLLQKEIKVARETILDADKAVAGRITGEEKNVSLNLCKEKQEFIDNTPDATTQDFVTHRMLLMEIVVPVLQKLNEPQYGRSKNHLFDGNYLSKRHTTKY